MLLPKLRLRAPPLTIKPFPRWLIPRPFFDVPRRPPLRSLDPSFHTVTRFSLESRNRTATKGDGKIVSRFLFLVPRAGDSSLNKLEKRVRASAASGAGPDVKK